MLTAAGSVLAQVGLELLRNDGGVFACHSDIEKTIKFSELGASSVIMNAGDFLDTTYTLNCRSQQEHCQHDVASMISCYMMQMLAASMYDCWTFCMQATALTA